MVALPAPLRRFGLLATMIALIGVSAPTPAEAQETIRLRLHHFLPAAALTHKDMLIPWAEEVEEKSGGRLVIDVFPAMQLGGRAPQLIEQARKGIVDIVWTLPGYTRGRFPLTEVFELPFLPASAEATSQAAQTYLEEVGHADFTDTVPLLLHTHEPGHLHFKGAVVETLEDMQGLKVRAPSRLVISALEALGAVPVGMPVPETPTALSRGVIDGTALPFEVVVPLKIHEIADSHTLVSGDRALYTATFVLAMNEAKYESLPADLQAILDQTTGLRMAKRVGRLWDAAGARGLALAQERGNRIVTLSQAEIDRWQAATAPIRAGWVVEMTEAGHDGEALLARAEALIAEFSEVR